MTRELKCTCVSAFQDQLYGVGMRLFNETGKDQKGGYRCTVCGRESRLGEDKKK